jgi:hypothetical protein
MPPTRSSRNTRRKASRSRCASSTTNSSPAISFLTIRVNTNGLAIINDARLAGRIDWDAIEDRTRNIHRSPSWDDPSEIVTACAAQYREDLWGDQCWRPEVWIEKDALVGVIEPVCERYRVPFFACRGYTSQSEQYRAGKRFEGVQNKGQKPIVLHLGDHDPSGIDMTRDNTDRLKMFAGEDVEVRRLALNMDQVRRHDYR